MAFTLRGLAAVSVCYKSLLISIHAVRKGSMDVAGPRF